MTAAERFSGIGMTSVRTRTRMVERLREQGIKDEVVLAAMNAVPRHIFVEDALASRAYENSPLPIGAGQTISQPFMVAYMVEAAEIDPGDRVLEVGTGSGYAAAVMSRIAGRVYTIERHATLAEVARQRFDRLGYDNIEVRAGDGTDFHAVEHGAVSLTPLQMDLTHHAEMNRVAEWLLD